MGADEKPIRLESAQATNCRTVFGRLFPDTELLDGIGEICRMHGIRNGVVVSCIGSLNFARLVWATPDPFHKMGFRYGEPKVIAGPLELISGQGTIGTKAGTGEIFVHLHAVMTEDSGVTWSGHVMEKGNPICVTAEIAIQAFDGMEIVRDTDEETNVEIFRINKNRFKFGSRL